MKRAFIGLLIGLALGIASTAWPARGHQRWLHPEGFRSQSWAFTHQLAWERRHVNRKRAALCHSRIVYRFERATDVPRPWLRGVVRYWRERHRRVHELENRCAPEIPPWPWLALAECESGQRWHLNAYHDGGFQFLPSTWVAAGGAARGYAYAYQAPAYVQYLVAKSWLARTSWSQWPVCSRVIGAR